MRPDEASFYLLIAIMSMAVCMAIIPIMMRLSPYIGMLDTPDERKVHLDAIPRSGGIGIVLGLLVPLFLWADDSQFSTSFIIGCLVLLLFGAWDDAKNLRPLLKLIGQIIAALIVVYYGEIYVIHFPFFTTEEIPAYIGKPFTVIAIVGMINALNLSDGLDGLAGGEALISLAAVAYMAYSYEGAAAVVIAAASIGGIFGFLRFNSHPARIFMGDAGSQTLGFIVAVLVVYLTQDVNPVVSPVVALLLLGLPIIDSIVVFYLRARRGDSLVVAAKDHLHHRLLAIGFYHYESVTIIYSLQILLVITAVLIPYESDFFLISAYFGLVMLLYSFLTLAEASSWKAHAGESRKNSSLSKVFSRHQKVLDLPFHLLKSGVSLFIVASAIMSSTVPIDFALSSILLLLAVFISRWFGENLYRLVMYTTIGFSVYLLSNYPPEWLMSQISLVYIFFIVMTLLAFFAARITVKDRFQITPLDYLVIIMAIIVSMTTGIDYGSTNLVWVVVQMIILFYACELVIQNMDKRSNSLTGAVALALTLIAYRGLA